MPLIVVADLLPAVRPVAIGFGHRDDRADPPFRERRVETVGQAGMPLESRSVRVEKHQEAYPGSPCPLLNSLNEGKGDELGGTMCGSFASLFPEFRGDVLRIGERGRMVLARHQGKAVDEV